MGQKSKSLIEKFMEGFKPMHERADAQVNENRQQYGDKLEKDLASSPEERAKKLREGFIARVKP